MGTVVSSALVAYSFARISWPGRNFWFALLLATMMLPDVVTLDTPFPDIQKPEMDRHMAAADRALLGGHRRNLRLSHAPVLSRHPDGNWKTRPRSTAPAASASLVQILLPLSKPVIATVAVFALLQHYNDFMNPLIYINSMDKWPLALGIRAYNDSYAKNWEVVFAASTVMLTPMVAIFIVAQRYFVQGIAMTGFGGR